MFQRLKFGHIIFQHLEARNIDGAINEILNVVQGTSNGSTIYFNGWKAFGTTAVLASMVPVLQSKKDSRPELDLERVMFIDCSTWISKRVMQRRIAEQLNLDRETMAIFDKQDEEDDFDGVDPTSRDAIRDVARVISRTLRDSTLMMIFLNGSDEEVLLSTMGVPQENNIIWTFKRRFPTKGVFHGSNVESILSKLRNTDIFLDALFKKSAWKGSEINALVHAEAASILTRHPCMREDDRAMVIDCYLCGLFMHDSFDKGRNRLWAAHGANYWICDGIIQGDRAREIIKALYQEVSFECDDTPFGSHKITKKMMLHPDTPYLVFYDPSVVDPQCKNVNRHRRWISITSKNIIYHENIKSILARASSIFLPFEMTNSPHGLPDDLIEQCSNLRVLILSYCAFNFSSPLFCHCHTLRFLGLDHCINKYTTAELVERKDNTAKWACLNSLRVLDLRHTEWDEILSEEKLDLMGNITDLNIEGSVSWQYIGQLEGRLPYIERLRIVKPLREAETSSPMEIDSSFMGKTKLRVVDLSGNKGLKNLPTSLSKTSSLEVLVLDGCDGLENVVLSNPMLRSFSFDGHGAASNWTPMDELPQESSRPSSAANKRDVKISLINLKGCTQLKNLFLRGLPNLEELELSGCPIKILDLETMMADVPRLRRLFLLGCEHLCAIRWGPPMQIPPMGVGMPVDLELLCIDTRPGVWTPGHTRPSLAKQPNKSFGLQVHAVTADARLIRSLCPLIYHTNVTKGKDVFFDIHITPSNIIYGEKTSEELHVVADASLYDDVFPKVIGDSSLTPMQAFPQPPTSWSGRHIEIGDGSRNVGSEVEVFRSSSLSDLMRYVQSLHVHDTLTSAAMPPYNFRSLEWCRVERCPKLDPVFPSGADPNDLETIWASDLLMARCIWSRRPRDRRFSAFRGLRHLHLRSCPSLRFALPIWSTSPFPKLESLHIIHCGSLKHVFALDMEEYVIDSNILFPELTTIYLHDVPALQRICEAKTMTTPKLETIRTKGCWSLRRLPAVRRRLPAVPRRLYLGVGRRRPVVEMEKNVWDALEWDVDHGPYLYEAPVHSRHYKRERLLRGTVLR